MNKKDSHNIQVITSEKEYKEALKEIKNLSYFSPPSNSEEADIIIHLGTLCLDWLRANKKYEEFLNKDLLNPIKTQEIVEPKRTFTIIRKYKEQFKRIFKINLP